MIIRVLFRELYSGCTGLSVTSYVRPYVRRPFYGETAGFFENLTSAMGFWCQDLAIVNLTFFTPGGIFGGNLA